MKEQKCSENPRPSLASILSKYRPINARRDDIARIKKLYSRLPSEVYRLYDLSWERLMSFVSEAGKGKAAAAAVSNLGFLCLLDLERTLFLQQRIALTMKMARAPEKLDVVDLGAGTGILGLTALELGAGKVTLVENDKECLAFLKALLPELGFRIVSKNRSRIRFSRGNQGVEVYAEDATQFKPSLRSERYDLVLCEMHETHLVSEDEVAALRDIRRYAKKDALFIPSGDELMLGVCDPEGKLMSDSVMIGSVEFRDIRKERVSFRGKLQIEKSGLPKYLRLWDRLHYPDGAVSEQDFPMFAQTKYMVLRGWKQKLRKGQSLVVRVNFRFGDRYYNGYSLELSDP